MSTAREEILHRIRGALHDVPEHERREDVTVPRAYRRTAPETERFTMFMARVADYRAEVARIDGDGLAAALDESCARLGLRRLVVAPGVETASRPAGVELVEDRRLSARELDAVDGALTGCAVAIAETGTIILDGSPVCGRRALTLVPDHHLCLVRAEQVVATVPEGVAALGGAVAAGHAPLTLISGPSASSDIELSRVEGVHGPRHLLVFLVD